MNVVASSYRKKNMSRTYRILAVTVLLSLLALGQSHHRSRRRSQAHNGEAGQFDFYLFVLSWSPEFCYSHATAAECQNHRGFVVHGLWPQNNDGTYPSNCATNQPAPSDPGSLGDIMPAEIIQHEWQTHGTCSGLSGDAYFALIRNLHDSIKIPSRFQSPSSSFAISPSQFKKTFEATNPILNDNELAIQLRGQYLNQLEICVAKEGKSQPVPCSNVRDANGGTFLVPPVR